MNIDQLEGKWGQIKGEVKKKWGKLTDNELTAISGKKDKLLGKIREHYGQSKEEATRDLTAFLKTCSCDSTSTKKDSRGKPASRPSV